MSPGVIMTGRQIPCGVARDARRRPVPAPHRRKRATAE
ncbi:hypothetical protein SCATT_50530 [Streptantibioticus cattleyicolor NRRL 8057 = DSM 46488]|uniref:Uncharacterized protein n=1 Tax=Streptantibioticus cattleyicolor (strain ATCC 35852 / DSM 46488 / JCM 4925 / NBRC 14057 / NRRL 8057) TaxID=1003195 RepID=G8X3Q1_STREN|nr:hypothetical protein SCATT_50530 [Streptantibioticus cattleyicolor NRRL 8057 = DSM 46488]